VHRLDDATLITTALIRRFRAEAKEYAGIYWAYIQKSDGSYIQDNSPGAPEMSPVQQVMARDLLNRMNADLAHDGAWVCMAIGPRRFDGLTVATPTVDYQVLMFLWLDADGDVRFPLEFEDTVENMARKGFVYWLEQAEKAWMTWKGLMLDVLDPTPRQLFKRAKGQDAPSLKEPTKH
jgi:hypothetical protein